MDVVFFALPLFFVFLAVGSFLGVLVERVVAGEPWLHGRSHCDQCKHVLGPQDLIPLLSYILQNGTCRYCKKRISPWLPIIELTTAIFLTVVVVWFSWNGGFTSETFLSFPPLSAIALYGVLFFVSLGMLLLLIFFTDARYQVIPDGYIVGLVALYILTFGIIIAFGGSTFSQLLTLPFSNIRMHLISACASAAFFALLYFGTRKKAMGDGDIFLSAALALYVPFPTTILFVFLAFVLGACVGVFLMIIKKSRASSKIAFGPFLVLSFVITFLFGNRIIAWYISLLSS